MAKFVVKYHFDKEHLLRYVVEAESMSDARSQIVGSIRGEDPLRIFEIRSEDNLYMIPVQAIQFIQIVEADREAAPYHSWNLD